MQIQYASIGEPDVKKTVLSDGDDYVVAFTADHFLIGVDDEDRYPIAVLFKIDDVTDYSDFEVDNIVSVNVAPCTLTDKAFDTVCSSMGPDIKREPLSIAYAADQYGFHAPIMPFAEGVSCVDGLRDQCDHANLKSVIQTDDYDTIKEWIDKYGDRVASAVAGLIGFALDRPVNRIGETGWDWLLPHMVENYRAD